jgi:hypothetical protein
MATSNTVQRLAESDVEHSDLRLRYYLSSATAEDESGIHDSRVRRFFNGAGNSTKQLPVRSDVPVSGRSASFFPDSPPLAVGVLFSRK